MKQSWCCGGPEAQACAYQLLPTHPAEPAPIPEPGRPAGRGAAGRLDLPVVSPVAFLNAFILLP